MAGARFRLGLGSGERLNEHVIGGGWPAPSVRQERFAEAIDVIRLLFENDGEDCSFSGIHFELDRARLFDRPEQPTQILVAAGGPRAARIAAEKADGLIATEPSREITSAYRAAGGEGARCAEVALCWAESEDEALDTMHRYARWSQFDWDVLAELATTRAFEAASKGVEREDLEDVPHGPDLERYVDAIRPYVEAGFDELILHQIGPEQDGFLNFFAGELATALRESDAHDARRSRPD
jgi:G6PDH family F420-dependent oxidoreductase